MAADEDTCGPGRTPTRSTIGRPGSCIISLRVMSTTRHQSQADPGADQSAPKLHVVTFGCQMNKYDSELVEGRFKRDGYVTTPEMGEADVVLFNTCSVRDHRGADMVLGRRAEARQGAAPTSWWGRVAWPSASRRSRARAGPRAGTRQFHLLPKLVAELHERRGAPDRFSRRERQLLATDMAEDVVVDREGEQFAGGRHAYLAVMRGCDLNCTYCIVPTTRGRVRSRPIDELVREARWYAEQGVQVLTLLGQTINSYGEDMPAPGPGDPMHRGRKGRPSLADLLYASRTSRGWSELVITLHPSYVNQAFAESIRDCSRWRSSCRSV